MLNIRKMNLADKDIVVAMDQDFYSGPAVDHEIPVSELEHTFEVALKSDYPLDGYILSDEHSIIGFAYVTWFHSTDVAGICVMIEEIYIKQNARGKGYGSQFIRSMFHTYKNARRFRLEVTKANESAASVYKKIGFDYISYDQMAIDIK